MQKKNKMTPMQLYCVSDAIKEMFIRNDMSVEEAGIVLTFTLFDILEQAKTDPEKMMRHYLDVWRKSKEIEGGTNGNHY